jgi:hypothetical protein
MSSSAPSTSDLLDGHEGGIESECLSDDAGRFVS